MRFLLDLGCSIKGVDPFVDDVGVARLRLEQPPIDAVRETQELRVRPVLDDAAMREDEDPIELPHR